MMTTTQLAEKLYTAWRKALTDPTEFPSWGNLDAESRVPWEASAITMATTLDSVPDIVNEALAGPCECLADACLHDRIRYIHELAIAELRKADEAAWRETCAAVDARIKELEGQVAEWEALGIRAEEMREKLDKLDAGFVWPPTGATQVCGWCVHAAGDTREAWDAAERFTLEDMRIHTRVCESNPLVVDLRESRTDNRTRWRDNAVTDTAERIAAWLEATCPCGYADCESKYRELAAGVRGGSWKEAARGN